MRALYDLGRYLTSFNFYEWAVQAEADGATTVVFDIRHIRSDKWPAAIARERFFSICEPGPALLGMGHEVIADGNAPAGALDFGEPGGRRLVSFCRTAGRAFKRLKSVREPENFRYTVTLRKTQRAPERNSDEAMWRGFAAAIGAQVIPDYEDDPIHLHRRMAMYAGAEMNFFVSNGPGILCSLSPYPCMMFNTHHAGGSLLGDGMEIGEQYPWMLANQRAVWDEATSESVMRHFLHWDMNGTFLQDDPKQLAAVRQLYGLEPAPAA